MAVWSERARHRQLLTKEQKRSNRELNRLRVVVEHVNRRLKIFKFYLINIETVIEDLV